VVLDRPDRVEALVFGFQRLVDFLAVALRIRVRVDGPGVAGVLGLVVPLQSLYRWM